MSRSIDRGPYTSLLTENAFPNLPMVTEGLTSEGIHEYFPHASTSCQETQRDWQHNMECNSGREPHDAPTEVVTHDPQADSFGHFGDDIQSEADGISSEDEDDQAHYEYESLRTVPPFSTPPVPNQHLPKKDAAILDQPNTGEVHLASKSKRDAKVSAASPGTQAQKPSLHPIPAMPMQFPFHQPQIPLQFGGPNPQIQSQAMSPQFPQQPAVIYSGSRKTVKITHPETHEELRLDSSPSTRLHPSMQSQSPHISSFPPHIPMNFYPSPYIATSLFCPLASSVPLNSTSQPPRLYNQVAVKSPVVSHMEKEPLLPSGSLAVGKAEASNVVKRDAPRGKKKKKELYIKAKAAGTSSDLYMAYMGSEKKKEIVTTSEGSENSSSIIEKQTSAEVSQENAAVCEKPVKNAVPRRKKKRKELYRKAEDAGTSSDLYSAYKGPEEKKEIVTTAEVPDDWEDAAEVSIPQLGTSRNENQNKDDGNGLRTKRYSRDFLLKFVGQCPDLPEGFEITSFLADTLVVSRVNISRESYSCPGHNIEGPEKKKEIVTTSEGSENSSCIIEKQTSAEVSQENAAVCEKPVKNAVPRRKKKRKELYRKAEDAGTSSDLYTAYKGPEEKKEIVTTAEVPDDWEDAAEVSIPQLGTSRNENQNKDDGNGLRTKRYSRDFLLKFVGQCTDLPEGFAITSFIAGTLVVSGVNISRESYPSPLRNIDRPVGGSGPDRCGSGQGDEDEWSKFPEPLMPGQGDMWTDVGYMNNSVEFQPLEGGNYGVLRNPLAQTRGQYTGGILSGPMHSLGPQGGLQRNSGPDRWQRGTGFQKGLLPSPQTPMLVMHEAEKKYEVGKVTDEEEAKQRQLKASEITSLLADTLMISGVNISRESSPSPERNIDRPVGGSRSDGSEDEDKWSMIVNVSPPKSRRRKAQPFVP